jgi:HAD superfamily hydrolase (TIGR01509 family)
MSVRAVIFDMDGVLVDSELYWQQCEKDLYPKVGVSPDPAMIRDIVGLKLTDIVSVIREKYNPSVDEKKLRALFDETAAKVYKRSSLIPGTRELIDALRRANIARAIASSSRGRWINMFLDTFHMHDDFDTIASAEDEGLPGKPDPAIYKFVMKKCGVTPQESVIVEDSQNGYQAALASGAVVIALNDPRWSVGPFPDADMVVRSLAELNTDVLRGLIHSRDASYPT